MIDPMYLEVGPMPDAVGVNDPETELPLKNARVIRLQRKCQRLREAYLG